MSEDNTEAIHRMFRGAAELAKKMRSTALAAEILAALIAMWRALNPQLEWSAWASFWLAILVVIGFALRVRAEYIYSFAEKCRRIASAAYARGLCVSSVIRTSLSVDEPILANRLSRRLPTQALDDYYEATEPAGYARMREIYAHSAFYSWRLMKVCFHVYLWSAVSLAAVGAAAIYAMAATPVSATIVNRVLDVVCSIVFAFLVARMVAACLSAWCRSRECESAAEELAGPITSERLQEVIVNYDIERACGPAIPTSVYLRRRNALQAEWHLRRVEMGPVILVA